MECTALSVYLMPVNHTLRMVNTVNFMLRVFYHNLKDSNNNVDIYHQHKVKCSHTYCWWGWRKGTQNTLLVEM